VFTRFSPTAATAAVALILALAAPSRRATAAPVTLGPGERLTLDQDIVLGPGDTFMASGTTDNPCIIEGQGHTITTAAGWQAGFVMRNCTVHALGSVDAAALEIIAAGSAGVVLDGNTFDASGLIHVNMMGDGPVQILRNTVLETSVVDVMMTSANNSVPAMLFDGSANAAPKVFQGNRIYRSDVTFDHTQNWLIGGDNPGEGNIIIGDRGSIVTNLASQMRIVGNYVRTPGDLNGWNQVKPLVVAGNSMLIEHNVIRDGNWLVDVSGSDIEIRYNLFGDSHDRPWLLVEDTDGSQKIHHNVFIRNDPNFVVDGVWVRHPDTAGPGTEIYNNTFHGGGTCWLESGPAVVVEPGAVLASLRSNAIVGVVTQLGADTAMVRGGGPERNPAAGEPTFEPKDPPPVRIGYADYNLFFNPQAAARDNYALAVAGKRERLDPGFALHDVPSGGSVDDQVDPMFAGGAQIPVRFPYDDAAIKAGQTTVCQILRFYRGLFAPGQGSPLAGAGDPADGAGNNVGAIGGPAAQDKFGTLCAGADVGAPSLGPEAFVCPPSTTGTGGVGGNGGTGGTGIVPGGKGFVCVCAEGEGAPPLAPATLALFLAALLLRLRSARPRRRSPPSA